MTSGGFGLESVGGGGTASSVFAWNKEKEPSGRAPNGFISATAGSRPVPSLNFDEACEAAPSSLTSHQAVCHAARLVIILLDKILSTIESNY